MFPLWAIPPAPGTSVCETTPSGPTSGSGVCTWSVVVTVLEPGGSESWSSVSEPATGEPTSNCPAPEPPGMGSPPGVVSETWIEYVPGARPGGVEQAQINRGQNGLDREGERDRRRREDDVAAGIFQHIACHGLAGLVDRVEHASGNLDLAARVAEWRIGAHGNDADELLSGRQRANDGPRDRGGFVGCGHDLEAEGGQLGRRGRSHGDRQAGNSGAPARSARDRA